MRIASITVWQETLPLAHPYRLSGGRLKFEALDSTFVRIDTDQGLAGWGEGPAFHPRRNRYRDRNRIILILTFVRSPMPI